MPFEPSLPPPVIVWLSIPPGKSGRRSCWRGSAGLRILGLFSGFPAMFVATLQHICFSPCFFFFAFEPISPILLSSALTLFYRACHLNLVCHDSPLFGWEYHPANAICGILSVQPNIILLITACVRIFVFVCHSNLYFLVFPLFIPHVSVG
jgi:hypothetical protein